MSAINDIEQEAYRRGQKDMADALKAAAAEMSGMQNSQPYVSLLSHIGSHANLSYWDSWSKDSRTEEELASIQETIDQAQNGEWEKLYKSGEELEVIETYPDIHYRWPDGGAGILHLDPEDDEGFMDWEDVEVV